MTQTLTKADIEQRLSANRNGTATYHRYLCGTLISDGVKELIKLCECNWLIEAIVSYQTQCQNDRMLRTHQFWELAVKEDRTARLTCFRDCEDPAFHQDFDYVTFPLDSMRVWVVVESSNTLIHLPSEW